MKRTIMIKGIEYEILKNPNNFNLDVTGNILSITKEFAPSERIDALITFDLERTESEILLDSLYNIGILLEESMQTAFNLWLEKNPQKTYEEFMSQLKRVYLNTIKLKRLTNSSEKRLITFK